MWLLILKILLEIVTWAARNADRPATSVVVKNELDILQGKRLRHASSARGSVQPDDDTTDDPYRRD